MPPLEAKEIADIDGNATKAERFWRCVPLLGWAISSHLWAERTRPIVQSIERQLKCRPEPNASVWGPDSAKVALARCVCQIAAEEMGWPNAHFIPQDPARVIFWAHQDGLDVESAILEMEQRLSIKIEDSEVTAWFGQTLGEVVEFLWTRHQAAHGQENIWPPAPSR